VKHAQTPLTTSPSYFTSFFFFLSFGNFFAKEFVVDEDIQELIRDGDNLGKKKKIKVFKRKIECLRRSSQIGHFFLQVIGQ